MRKCDKLATAILFCECVKSNKEHSGARRISVNKRLEKADPRTFPSEKECKDELQETQITAEDKLRRTLPEVEKALQFRVRTALREDPRSVPAPMQDGS